MKKLPVKLRECDKTAWNISKVLQTFKCELTAREKITPQRDSVPQSDVPYSDLILLLMRKIFSKAR